MVSRILFDVLWFDVETRYKTTKRMDKGYIIKLWFDVETRYKTTDWQLHVVARCCGLM